MHINLFDLIESKPHLMRLMTHISGWRSAYSSYDSVKFLFKQAYAVSASLIERDFAFCKVVME